MDNPSLPNPEQQPVLNGPPPPPAAEPPAPEPAAPVSTTAPPTPEEDAPETPLTPRQWLIQNSPFLFLLIGGLFLLVKFQGWEGVPSALLTIFAIGFIIFVHELGHFAVAKWCDVHVLTFSIGFGPAIPGCSFKRGETTYKLSLLPLGGYVNMVGEGSDTDEGEDYPRSFKNKPVGQRMLIISAGVIMNVILGAICFIVVYLAHGVERHRPTISRVDPGGVAWVEDVRAGWVIDAVGDNDKPTFEDFRTQVILGSDLEVRFVDPYEKDPRKRVHQMTLHPQRAEHQMAPSVGVSPPARLELPGEDQKKLLPEPTFRNTGAASAKAIDLKTGEPTGEGGFKWGDVIVGSSVPPKPGAKYDPRVVEEVPVDPRRPDGTARDPYEFRRRMRLLAGKDVVIQVRRAGAKDSDEQVNLLVPPSYTPVVGTRMEMGKVAAVRSGSPAERVGLRGQRTSDAKPDEISGVRIEDDKGNELVLGDAPKDLPPAARRVSRPLDPVRLAFDLAEFAGKYPGTKKVTLVVVRGTPHQDQGVALEPMLWDHDYDDNVEGPFDWTSPLSIPQLGLAYWVKSTIRDVAPGSPAARAQRVKEVDGVLCKTLDPLKQGDVITRVRYWDAGEKKSSWSPWYELSPEPGKQEENQWGYAAAEMRTGLFRLVQFTVRRNTEKVEEPFEVVLEEDPTWPMPERGIRLTADTHLVKADNLWQALTYGGQETWDFIKNIYRGLSRIIAGRVSTKTFQGPISIVSTTFGLARDDGFKLILFMGVLSINLAVVNFLPIPLLDGGHMVFLIYEKIRGKPASETFRNVAAYVGLLLLLALMVYVIVLDIQREIL